jgi:hypothetical protein
MTDPDPVDELLAEIESVHNDGKVRDPHQLELFGTMLTELQQMQRRPGVRSDHHQVATLGGHHFRGTWEEILDQLKAADRAGPTQSMTEFMRGLAIRGKHETGVTIPVTDAEAFIAGAAEAGVLRIIN